MCTVHMSWFLLSNKPFDAVEENEKCLDTKKSLLFSPIHSFVFIIKSDARPQIIPFQTSGWEWERQDLGRSCDVCEAGSVEETTRQDKTTFCVLAATGIAVPVVAMVTDRG